MYLYRSYILEGDINVSLYIRIYIYKNIRITLYMNLYVSI